MARASAFQTPAALLILALARPQMDRQRLTASAVKAYRSAVHDVRTGETDRGAAVLSGLLLSRQVKVRIDTASIPRGRESAYNKGAELALAAWDNALPDSPFLLAKPGEHPDVTVRFVKALPKGSDIQGAIDVTRDFSWGHGIPFYSLKGGILLKDNAFGRALTGAQIGRVLSHEFGHLLGLADDYDGAGVMSIFRADEGWVPPSAAEIEAVTTFRSDCRSVLEEALG